MGILIGEREAFEADGLQEKPSDGGKALFESSGESLFDAPSDPFLKALHVSALKAIGEELLAPGGDDALVLRSGHTQKDSGYFDEFNVPRSDAAEVEKELF